MKLKVDYNGFNEDEIEFVKDEARKLQEYDKKNGFTESFGRYTFYFYNISTCKDEITVLEGSLYLMPYYMKSLLKAMNKKGYSLPYKTEFQKLSNEEEIAPLRLRESLVEL